MPENHGWIKAPSRDDVYGGEDGYGQYEWLRDLAATANLSDLDAREKAALALTVAENMIVHGTTPPDSEGSLWVDTDEDAPPTSVSWDDLTGKPDEFPPTAHTHSLDDVTGLAARLAALGYDSGTRALHPYVSNRTNGNLFIRKMGNVVLLNFDYLILGDSGSGNIPLAPLPAGWRPAEAISGYAVGATERIRVSASGNVQVFDWQAGAFIAGTVSWLVPGVPATKPGDPA